MSEGLSAHTTTVVGTPVPRVVVAITTTDLAEVTTRTDLQATEGMTVDIEVQAEEDAKNKQRMLYLVLAIGQSNSLERNMDDTRGGAQRQTRGCCLRVIAPNIEDVTASPCGRNLNAPLP